MRILVAIDGSNEAYEAVRALHHFGKAESVTLLHVLDVPRPAYPMMAPEVPEKIHSAVLEHRRAEGEHLLDRAASLLPSGAGGVTKVVEVGKPSEVIMSCSEQSHADLIALGARGVRAAKELLLGSVSHRVLSLAHGPVLVVREPIPSIRRVLLSLEGPEDAEAAVRFLKRKPFRGTPAITILTAATFGHPPWPVTVSVSDAMRDQVLKGACSFAEDVAAQLSSQGYSAEGIGEIGAPSATILKEVGALAPDLVLMGTRRRKGVTRFLLGSVSHAVLHQAKCPVLTFPWPGA